MSTPAPGTIRFLQQSLAVAEVLIDLTIITVLAKAIKGLGRGKPVQPSAGERTFKPMSNVSKAAGVMAITALLYGMDIIVRLVIFPTHPFDPSIFIVAGKDTCHFEQIPIPLLHFGLGGYDGQYYFRLAMDPFTNQQAALGIPLDHPGYRQQRILYPALVHALSLGRPQWMPWTMILLDYAAICALGFTAGLFALAFGRHALWGLVIPFYPGLLFSLNRDLTEVLALSLAVAALYLLHRRRILVGAVTLALAILTRESVVVLAGALLAMWGWRMLYRQARWTEGACLMIPLAAFAACQLWIFSTWGSFGIGMQAGGGAFGFPLKALGALVASHLSGFPTPPRVFLVYELILLIGAPLLAATAVSGSRIDGGVKVAWAAYLAFACVLSGKVWINDEAFLRVLSEMMVLSFLVLLGSRYSRLFRILFVLELVIWNMLALLPSY